MSYATVFKDESKLDINYTPPRLQHRDFAIKLLNEYFRHALEAPGKMTQRVIITGNIGTGKTVLAQHFGRDIIREAEQRHIKLQYIHVNCRQNKGSFFLILQQIVTHFHPGYPKRGYSAEELLQTLMQILDNQNTYLIATLDELETLIQNEGTEPMYKLSRVEENRTRTPRRLSLICILRELKWLNQLDQSTKSTLQSNIIQLDTYTKPQLQDILLARVKYAFQQGTVPLESVVLTAELGEEEAGNARYAIELLWRAGKYADAEGEKEVIPEHIRKAAGSVYSNMRKDEIKILDHHKKLFLLGIARRFKQTRSAHITTGEAEESYQIVCEEFSRKPRKHTQLWKYMKDLVGLGVIKTEPSPNNRVGKTTLIGLPRIAAVDLERELDSILKYTKKGRS